MCLLTAKLLVLAVLLTASYASKCRISATLHISTTSRFTFQGGHPVMVDVLKGQKVTVKCHGSVVLGIHLHRPMMGNKMFEGRQLELTPETFKPGNYRCKCRSLIEGVSNISLPLAVTAVPQFAHSQQSFWTARQGDEVALPCSITNALEGVTYQREWRHYLDKDSYTIIQAGSKYAFSGKHLIIRNVSEDDTMARYTCAVTGLSTEHHNDLQGQRPSSGFMHIKLLHDAMPVLDILNKMATCSSLETDIDAQYCLTVTTTTGRLNKHCHSGSARGSVHNAREVGCTVTQHANGSSSVITNQHSKSLTSEPTADYSNGDLQIASKLIRDESADQSKIEISFILSQEGCHGNSARHVMLQQHVGKIIWTVSNGTAVNYTVVHNSSKRNIRA